MSDAARGGTDWLTIAISYWWVWLLIGGGILDWIAETFDIGVAALHRRSKLRHKRKLELKKVELRIAQARAGRMEAPTPAPGLCRHRKAVPVRDGEGDVVAWLCRSCDTQLPKEFSVYTEDL